MSRPHEFILVCTVYNLGGEAEDIWFVEPDVQHAELILVVVIL